MAVLKNVKVKWVSVIEPNTTFESEWQCTVVLNEELKERLIQESKEIHPKGIKIKVDDDGDLVFRFKRKVNRADGGENNPPVCKSTERDANGKLKDFDKLIGNGSVCNVQYGFYAWENKFGKGVGADFKGIQVVEHVPYGVADGEEFEDLDEPAKSSDDEGFDDEDF